jgi:hypothetical protein
MVLLGGVDPSAVRTRPPCAGGEPLVRPASKAFVLPGALLGAVGQKGAGSMFEALSTSRWRWTLRFLLLCCASVLMFFLAGLLSLLFPPDGGPAYYVAALSLAGFVVGVIGAAVASVMTMLRRHSPRAKPVA